VAHAHRPDDAPLYELAAAWVQRCLRGDGSLFDSSRSHLWTVANFERLREIFNEQPDDSSDPFLVKLGRQLAGASDDLVLLFAEVLYVHLLIANDIGGPAKRDNVSAVLAQMDDGLELPVQLDERLERGLVNTGVAYKTFRPQQLWLFIDTMIALKSKSQPEREATLDDPWRFRELVHEVPHEAAFTQRNALLHLVHPDTFEDCVSRDHKQQIAAAYSHLTAEMDDVDRALLEIRRALEEEAGSPINFYDEPYQSQWARVRLQAWDVLEEVAPVVTQWERYDLEERDYKLELAQQLRELYDGERPEGWSVDVVRAIARTNLVNYRPLGRLRSWGVQHPGRLDAAFAALVEADDPIAALDGLSGSVGEVLPTRGARLSVGAVVLMGRDASRFVPWRAQASATYRRLLGVEAAAEGTDGEHFRSYLEMLDLVREELGRRGVRLRDPLDAQSLLWVVAGNDLDAEPFASLPRRTRRKLASWRGDEGIVEEDEQADGGTREERWRADRFRQITDAASELAADRSSSPEPTPDERRTYAVEALDRLHNDGNLVSFVEAYRESGDALRHTRKGAHQTFLGALANRTDEPREAAQVLAAALRVPTSEEQIEDHLEPFVELAQRTGTPHAPAPGMAPLVASAFWHLQDARWLPLYRSAENALNWWGWLPSTSTATERYRAYVEVLRNVETAAAFGRVGNGWFPGLDPSLVERMAANREEAEDEDACGARRRNLEHVRADLKILDRCFVESLTRQLGQPLETVSSSFEGRSESDAFIAWRPRNSVANPPPDVRLWVTADGVAVGVHPGGGREHLTESLRIAEARRPEDVELLAITIDQRGRRIFGGAEQIGEGTDFLIGRWYPGSSALGRGELLDDLAALVSRLKPLLGAWLAHLGTGAIPIVDQQNDGVLALQVKRFLDERGYPSLKDRQRIEARSELRAVLTREGLDTYDLDGLRKVINSNAGGNPGPQSVLNSTLRDASPEDLEGFFSAVRYLLWDGAENEAARIDRLLDKGDLGAPGLGESVIVKLLATAHPERWVPVFPLRGDMGKVRLLEALDLPYELIGTTGEQHVAANEALRQQLEPYFPGDTWGMKDFAYWLASQEDVEEAIGEVDLVEKAATDLHVSVEFLREIVDLLREKKQIILYGPPGTGKTYLARRLARALVNEDESRYRLVQFHPSYSYEDFFEGYRPDVDADGQLTYQLQQGAFAQMAEAAEASPAAEHVMIIDEINRANLPKVFGELLFLLEYRDEPAYTQYRPNEPFTVPKKLYLIGTMNTADRSIALVDAALRRRFHFVGFFPHEGEVAGLLRRWLEAVGGQTWVADLLDQVNAELRHDLGGPHLQIGPSYFMVDGLDEAKLQRIWRYSIHPYIEEQLFGQQDRIDTYRFEAVWARFQADRATMAGADDEEP
jgi:5-methylcytosine-specific restriction enzyme B